MSKIEWTEQTWNPIVGCSIVSPGCTNCYAMRMAARIEAMKRSHYDGTTKRVNGNAVWTGKLALAPDHILLEPLRRRKPTLWFVNSMGDLFHEDAPDAWIDKVFAVMALTPQHTYQVLTKRADRMRQYLISADDEKLGLPKGEGERRDHIVVEAFNIREDLSEGRPLLSHTDEECIIDPDRWPLPNVWLGVSTERQKEADERIPLLMQTPAAVRFISAEPLLEPVAVTYLEWAKLDWVICGGESGPGARPMHPDWARKMRDQCAAAGIPFFFKQWGAWGPLEHSAAADKAGWEGRGDWMILDAEGRADIPDHRWPDEEKGEAAIIRLGKKAAGRTLDGKIHDAMPGPMQREAM